MKLVDSETMAAIDRRAQDELGYPSILLMENAGLKALLVLKAVQWGGRMPEGPLTFVAGKGNNGGDAFVMARQCLLDGSRVVTVVLAGGRPAEGTDPAVNLKLCEKLGIPVIEWPAREAQAAITRARWLFDGVAGTGLRGPLREPLAGVVAAMNASPGRRVAIDVPSGVGDGFRAGFPAVRARVTLTMGLPKRCLYLPSARPLCGRILPVKLGFPPVLVEDPAIPGELLSLGAWRRLLPPVPADAHKNTRGHLAVFAGSRGTTGAAWLAATAAGRARAGLVTVYLGEDVYPLLASRFSSVMARPWDESSGAGFDPSRHSGLLVGPGWGLSENRGRQLERLLSLTLPGVIDADGLTLLGRLGGPGKVRLGARWVLTPHPGEFTRLSGVERAELMADPLSHALALASRMEAVVVLKGACTFIAAPDGRHWIHDGMSPELATGGSGDVLAGLIAAFVAGGIPPLEAALCGVSLHGTLGRVSARRYGWFLAEDMIPLVSRVLHSGRRQADVRP